MALGGLLSPLWSSIKGNSPGIRGQYCFSRSLGLCLTYALSNSMLFYRMLSGPFDNIQWWSYLSVLDRYSNLLTDYGSGSTLAMCPWVFSIDLIHELLFLISSWGSYHDIWSCFAVVTEDGDPKYRYPFVFTDFTDVGWTSLEDHLSTRVILIHSLASASKITTLELSMKLLYWIYKISISLWKTCFPKEIVDIVMFANLGLSRMLRLYCYCFQGYTWFTIYILL